MVVEQLFFPVWKLNACTLGNLESQKHLSTQLLRFTSLLKHNLVLCILNIVFQSVFVFLHACNTKSRSMVGYHKSVFLLAICLNLNEWFIDSLVAWEICIVLVRHKRNVVMLAISLLRSWQVNARAWLDVACPCLITIASDGCSVIPVSWSPCVDVCHSLGDCILVKLCHSVRLELLLFLDQEFYGKAVMLGIVILISQLNYLWNSRQYSFFKSKNMLFKHWWQIIHLNIRSLLRQLLLVFVQDLLEELIWSLRDNLRVFSALDLPWLQVIVRHKWVRCSINLSSISCLLLKRQKERCFVSIVIIDLLCVLTSLLVKVVLGINKERMNIVLKIQSSLNWCLFICFRVLILY